MNTYMLSAALRKKTGESLSEFLSDRLFGPLGIMDHYWETCPMGIEKGGWGLYLCLEDLAKIAQLYLQGGLWNGEQILSPEWLKLATSPQIATPNGEMKQGYGFQIWIGEDGAYQFNGAFGQYAIVMPDRDAAAVIFSGSGKLFAQTSIMDMINGCLWASSEEPLPAYPQAGEKLKDTLSSLRLEYGGGSAGLNCEPRAFERMAETLNRREYRLEHNYGSVFPQPLQHVHGCYSRGADMLRFGEEDGVLAVTVYEHFERNTVYVRKDGGFTDSVFRIRDEAHLISTRGLWREADGEIWLELFISFLETPDTRIIRLHMWEEELEAVFDERPTAEGATLMLMELVGMMDESAMKRLAPAMKHVPGLNENSIRELTQKYSAPGAAGRLIRCHDL